jgi:hypothetical protein
MSNLLAYGVTLPVEAALVGLTPLGILALVGLFPPVDPDDYSRSFPWRVGLVLAWLLVPVAAMFVFKLYQGGYLRFILPADFALSLLVARGLWMGYAISRPTLRLTPRAASGIWIRLVVILLAAFALAPTIESLANLYSEPAYARDDYRGLARHLRAVAGPDDAIILNGPNQWEVFTYYYPPDDAIHPLPLGDTEAELEDILATSDRAYAVFYGENERDPQRIVEGTLDARAFEAETRWYGEVRLVTYGLSDLEVAEPAVSLDAAFGDDIRLLGYTLDADDARPGGLLNLALYWQADSSIEDSYSVFVHLLDDSDTVVAQHDGVPGGGLRFTNGWLPGETITDHHGVLLPADLPPGDYTLIAGLFLPETGDRLPATLEGAPLDDHLDLTSLTIE